MARPFVERMEPTVERVAEVYRASYRTEILIVRAYRTGEFHNSVTVATPSRFAGAKVVDVDSDVYRNARVQNERPEGIGSLIEAGTFRMAPRYPASRAIKEAEPIVLGLIRQATSEAIEVVEKG